MSNVRQTLSQFRLAPHRKWGQNFLSDENIARKIVEYCRLESDDYVVEIGPGLGALTPVLAARCQRLLAVEIDRGMEMPLREALKDTPNAQLLFADILGVDLESHIAEAFQLEELPSFKVCGNIPYNITSPIIFSLLQSCPHLVRAVLMIQKEVAERLLAKPGSKDYGLLTLSVRYHCDVEYLTTVSKHCFYPQPEVESAVVALTPIAGKRVKVADEAMLFEFMRACFQKRRKTMLNNCSGFFRRNKEEIALVLDRGGISCEARPENLFLEQYAQIVDSFAAQGVGD